MNLVVALHGSVLGLVDVVSVELKINVVLEYLWVLAQEHWGGQDQYESEDDDSGIDLHYWWLLSIWSLEIVGQEFEKHVGEDGWVDKFDAQTEVNLEEWHPPRSGFWGWTR